MKKKINVRELLNQLQVNCDRISEIADACEKEQRERTEAETAEYNTLTSANEIIRMKINAAEATHAVVANDPDAAVRENLVNRGRKVTIQLQREVTPQTTADLADTGIIPIQEQEMLKPMRLGLIWDKVGINVRTGLSGTLRWPKHGKAVAQFADEGARLTDSKIDWSKLETTGKRLGIAIPVTREELDDSRGVVESVIREEMPAAITDAINAAMFCVEAGDRKTYGPFVKAAEAVQTFAGAEPTRKELLKMKTTVAKAVKLVAPCWVMTEDMKAILEDIKVDAGSGRFLCENDHVLGYPVFVTDAIPVGYIGFGDWSYQAAGFFGQMSVIADPYTLARNNAVDFVLNTRFGTVTLREDAFVLGKVGAGA